MRLANAAELADWDARIVANPDRGNVLQSKAFADAKKLHGWQPKFWIANNDIAVLSLSRRVAGLGEYWYIPKGPGVADIAQWQAFCTELPPEPFAVRMDPEILWTDSASADLAKSGLRQSSRNIQYNTSTVVINLAPAEDAILDSFKQKTRYNIRLAERKGVEVVVAEATKESIDTMYALMAATSQRAGFYLRSKKYFADFWSLHAAAGRGQFFFAKFQGKVLAGVFITFLGMKALYKDGGSIREHGELQAPYLLQWRAMQWLKSVGVSEYDLHGTPPPDQLDNPSHPLAGLARFKTGFSSQVIRYIGTYDWTNQPVRYAMWRRLGERAAMAYTVRKNKELFY